MDDLLRSISWHAEKQFRRRGRLDAVIWVTEAADGVRNMFETPCTNAPDAVTDAELLAGLANDTALDFAESGNIARFSVAYLARRVTVIRPVDPASTMQPTTTKRRGIVIELHSATEHLRVFREIVHLPRGRPVLAAAETLDDPGADGLYGAVLQRAATAAGVVLW